MAEPRAQDTKRHRSGRSVGTGQKVTDQTPSSSRKTPCSLSSARQRSLEAGGFGEVPQAAGGGVPVHPGAAAVQQDRPAVPEVYRPVDGPADRGRQRHQDDLGALAAHPQHPMAVFLGEIGDARAGGFEDPQAEQAKHGHQREVVWVRRLPGGGEQGLELQVREPQGRQGGCG
jgi:hypothetical protein